MIPTAEDEGEIHSTILAPKTHCPCDGFLKCLRIYWTHDLTKGRVWIQMYVAVGILLSSAVDCLLLLGTNRLCGYRAHFGRCLLGALAGGLHSGLCMWSPLHFLGNPVWRAVSLVAMAIIGFGMHRSTWRRGCVFAILSLALNGIIQSLGSDGVVTVAMAAVGL